MKETNRNRANVAKRRARQRKLRNRRIALTVCLMLVVMVASIGGTVAWLTATTDPVTNTFTYGDINIDLYEHKYDASTNTLGNDKIRDDSNKYKIIPGVNLPKDPTVEVKAGSEACWLFVKVDQSEAFASGVTYDIADGWTQLTGEEITDTVYYRQVGADAANDQTFDVLEQKTTADGKTYAITVSNQLTKTDVENQGTVTLKFTAYAIQQEGFDTPAAAWAEASK